MKNQSNVYSRILSLRFSDAENNGSRHMSVSSSLKVVLVVLSVLMNIMPLKAETESEEVIKLRKQAIHDAIVMANKEQVVSKRSTAVSLSATAADSSTVTIENLSATQREGTYRDNAIVDISYDLKNTDRLCDVSVTALNDGAAVQVSTVEQNGDIGTGVQPGDGKHIVWYVGKDWPSGYSDKFQVKLTAQEMDVGKGWATVVIEWTIYGGKDVDICAFWSDMSSQKVGWSWENSYNTLQWPSRDNTGAGPEWVVCDAGFFPELKTLHIHFNYYGTAGSPAKVKVTAKKDGVTLSKESTAGTRTECKAYDTDPGVVITFGEGNKPASIVLVNQ